MESDEDDANDAAIENGDLAFFDGHLRVVSNFTAAGVTYDYEWENAIRAPDVSANPTGDDGDDLERLRIGGEDFIVRGQGSRFFGSFQSTVGNSGIQVDIPGMDDTEDGDIVTFRLPTGVIAPDALEARLRINSGDRLNVVYSDRQPVGLTSMLGSGDVRWRVQRHDGRYFLLDTDAFRHTQTVITQISGNDEFLVGDASGLNFAPAKIRATELARELAERTPLSAFTDAIRYGLIVFENRNPTESDYANHRLFFDGITVRRVRRTPVPGHDRVVVFREDNLGISQYGTGIYVNRQAADDVPGTPAIGERYYNRNQAHWEIWEAGNYWNTAQFIAAPVDAQGPLWIGERGNEAEAAALADRADEIAAYPDDGGTYVLHRVVSVTAGTEDGFRYELEPILEVFALSNAEIDDDESDVQGTVSGRTLARGVRQHERFTSTEQEILDDLARVTFPHPTDDWAIRQTYFALDFFADRYETFLSLGWDADDRLRALSGAGRVARLGGHDRGRIYDGSDRLRSGLISGDHWLFLRDNETHGGSDIERAPVDGGDSTVEFEINSVRYFSMFADPDTGTLLCILRRISSTDMEVGILAYDAAAGTVTAEDTITLTLAHINAALGSDFSTLTDIHRESAGGAYEGVAGGLLEGDTLYLLLTHILKTDGHTTSALLGFTLEGTPNNRTLTVLAEDAVDELPIPSELTSGILPLFASELFLASDTAAYRLSPPETEQSDWDETDASEHSYIRNTDEAKALLADIPNLERKTGDLIVHTTRTWADATDAEVTGFAGRPASLGDITGETYSGSLAQGVAEDYIVVRIPLANDLRDYRVNQTDTGYEHNWQNLELIDVDATYRYGGTFVHIVGGSTIRAQYSGEQVHTSYRGDIGIDRPTAEEIVDGTSVDPAVSSVSDIVAIGNAHTRHSLANSDPG